MGTTSGPTRDTGDSNAALAAELAAVYDAIHAGRDDAAFWREMAASVGGPLLELGCGTGRVLLPLARAGYEISGLDLSAAMLERCRAKLEEEPTTVRARVSLHEADMASFDLERRFAIITVPFGGFQQLLSVKRQLACLERCLAHLRPHGVLILDLPNVSPVPPSYASDQPADGEATAQAANWTNGRRIRWWTTVTDCRAAVQTNECEVTYEISEADGSRRRISETITLRYVFRYELEHLLVRAGFRIVDLYGDYDTSPFAGESPAMIVLAQLTEC